MVDAGPIVDVIAGQSFPRSESVGCPICGRHHDPRRVSAHFGMTAMVAECPDCRIAYQTPRPSVEASRAYMNWRWQSADAYVGDHEHQLGRALEQISWMRPFVQAPLRLVDFGAGAGSFVRAALDQGWDATGIELSDAAIARAKEYFGVELRTDFGEGLYDVATMWDVVEHLRDLRGTLSMVRERLRPNGLLFLETGNFENWTRVAEQDRWGLYLLDHQFYFSPSSLERVLEVAGFGDFRILDVNHTRPSLSPRRILRHPARAVRAWSAWARARREWPAHGDIYAMVAVVRKYGD